MGPTETRLFEQVLLFVLDWYRRRLQRKRKTKSTPKV